MLSQAALWHIWATRRARGDLTNTIIQILSAALPGIITSVVMALWNKKQKERDEIADEKEQARAKSELLRISLLVATAQLSYAVAMAVKRGKPNGEIEVGVAQYEKSMEEFRQFEREQIARQ